jgi:hypothetical protein
MSKAATIAGKIQTKVGRNLEKDRCAQLFRTADTITTARLEAGIVEIAARPAGGGRGWKIRSE